MKVKVESMKRVKIRTNVGNRINCSIHSHSSMWVLEQNDMSMTRNGCWKAQNPTKRPYIDQFPSLLMKEDGYHCPNFKKYSNQLKKDEQQNIILHPPFTHFQFITQQTWNNEQKKEKVIITQNNATSLLNTTTVHGSIGPSFHAHLFNQDNA